MKLVYLTLLAGLVVLARAQHQAMETEDEDYESEYLPKRWDNRIRLAKKSPWDTRIRLAKKWDNRIRLAKKYMDWDKRIRLAKKSGWDTRIRLAKKDLAAAADEEMHLYPGEDKRGGNYLRLM